MFIHTIKSQPKHSYAPAQTITVKNSSSLSVFLKKLITILQSRIAQPIIAMAHFKKLSIRNHYVLALGCAILFFSSCEKEQASSSALNSTSSDSSADARRWHRWNNNGNGNNGNNGNKDNNGNGNGKGNGGNNGNGTQYGSLIGVPDNAFSWLGFQLDVADELGISCIRSNTLVPSTFSVSSLLNSGYNVVLNFNVPRRDNGLTPFAKDLDQYRQDLRNILNSYLVKPVVAVIENEESNRFYYSGTPQDYIDQLSVAIDVMHSYGVKVTNGGLTNQGLNYLVYKDLLDQGRNSDAEQFKNLTNVVPNNSDTQDRGDFIDKLLAAYTRMDLNYINFHWKGTSPDTQALDYVVSYLKKRTGKPIMSNEFGQFDTDPNTVTALLKKATDEGFPYILWYSPDENADKNDTPLHHSDASLTRSGNAYSDFIDSHD